MESYEETDYNLKKGNEENADVEKIMFDTGNGNYLENCLQNSTVDASSSFCLHYDKEKSNTSKISMVNDSQTTENFLKEFNSFYSEMMGKVKGLKDTPALQSSLFTEDLDMDEEKLFKNLKYTPEVQAQLSNIKKLDEGISTIISEYKLEKEDRLKTQFEMCNEIATSDELMGRDDELFLNLCQFEFLDPDDEKNKNTDASKEKRNIKQVYKSNDFIKRNIKLAKNGAFANSSLTDEEKFKLEHLLENEDFECFHRCKDPSNLTMNSNAYTFSEGDNNRLKHINFELEKFKLDENESEKVTDTNNGINLEDEIEKLNNFLLKQRLKKLDSQLTKLHQEEKEQNIEKVSEMPAEKTTVSKDELLDLKEVVSDKSMTENDELEEYEVNNDGKTDDEDFEEIYRRIMSESDDIIENYSPMGSSKDNEMNISDKDFVVDSSTESLFGDDNIMDNNIN